jgi:hypothetical protein
MGAGGVSVTGRVRKSSSVVVGRFVDWLGEQAETTRKMERRKKMCFERMGAILP